MGGTIDAGERDLEVLLALRGASEDLQKDPSWQQLVKGKGLPANGALKYVVIEIGTLRCRPAQYCP